MNIVIITQDEPFYLKDNLTYLLDILPRSSKVVGCVVNDVSPFGKKESFLDKALKTLKIFGPKFFLYYSCKFIFAKVKGSSVSSLLNNKSIPEIKLKKGINHEHSVRLIKSYKPDLLISILGNQIFKTEIINLAPKGCLNLHTALLPKNRGLMPTFWAMKNGDLTTGVSVFYVDEGIDSGPILVQEEVDIGDMTQAELIMVTKRMGMEAIAKGVDLILKDQVKLIQNNPEEASYYSFPTSEDVKEFLSNGNKFF